MSSSVPSNLRIAGIEVLKLLREQPQASEAVVRQAIVQRFLEAAGFNIWNPSQIIPEDTSLPGYRPDFIVRGDADSFALEIKSAEFKFKPKEYQQAINYAAGHGIRWAILTNGRVWIILDERAHGVPIEREKFRFELTEDNLDVFSSGLASILNKEVWDKGLMGAVELEMLHRRQNDVGTQSLEAKRSIVDHIQNKYGISSFEKAVDLAVTLGKITTYQAEALIAPESPTELIRFYLRLKGAEAKALYRPKDGAWIILAGSTALNRLIVTTDNGIRKRRARYMTEGRLKVSDENPELLVFLENVAYSSSTTAAQDVVGGARNGWASWVDEAGESAEKYKPARDAVTNQRGRSPKKVKVPQEHTLETASNE